MKALDLVSTWPVEHVAASVVRGGDNTSSSVAANSSMVGDVDRSFALASLTKPLSAWAIMVGVEEGIISLDGPLDRTDIPADATMRHLLAHAAGFPFEGDTPIASVAQRRIYSNTGIERAADVLAQAAAMTFDVYLTEAVLKPLGMTATSCSGSAAHAATSTARDMVAFLNEMMSPVLIAPATFADITSPQYPDLSGIVPGVGKFDPCEWGLGVEIRGTKWPHWMGRTNSGATFGHFGGAGTMMWVDPEARIGVVALTDRRFDQWTAEAMRMWPEFSDAVLAEALAGA